MSRENILQLQLQKKCSELARKKCIALIATMSQLGGEAVCPPVGDLGSLRSKTTKYLIVAPFTWHTKHKKINCPRN